MKLLIAGMGNHGKDMVSTFLGLRYRPTSLVALDTFVWDQWGSPLYDSLGDCFKDRRNNRAMWFDLYTRYNTPDKAAFAKTILRDNDIYCGLRCSEELRECDRNNLFDLKVWVDASKRLPPEGRTSCTVTAEMCHVVLNNNDTEEDFYNNDGKLLRDYISVRESFLSKGKKLTYGIGVNDNPMAGDPYQVKWRNMLKRCYSTPVQKAQPTYKGCSVTIGWLLFSNFKKWMQGQDWEGKQLDKDLLVKGNKIYSPTTCVFVDAKVSLLLCDSPLRRGKWPLGVSRRGTTDSFKSYCTENGKQVSLGSYNTPEEAHKKYCEYKSNLIKGVAYSQTDPRVVAALKERAKEFTVS